MKQRIRELEESSGGQKLELESNSLTACKQALKKEKEEKESAFIELGKMQDNNRSLGAQNKQNYGA